MKFLKWLLSMVVIAFIGLVLVGFMLPREISASRTALIAMSVDRVFAEIATPKSAKDWLPVGALDAKTVYEFSGPETGNDAAMKWSNPEFRDYGRGKLTVVQAHPNDRIEYSLDLEKMGTAQMRFELAEDGVKEKIRLQLLSPGYAFHSLDTRAGPVDLRYRDRPVERRNGRAVHAH